MMKCEIKIRDRPSGLWKALVTAMIQLHPDTTDEQFLAYADMWVSLLEAEDYEGALAMVRSGPEWTPELLGKVIKSYGDADPAQTVTLEAKPTDVSQRREVERWDDAPNGTTGGIWYDLGINGFTTDLTATFTICAAEGGLELWLDDIHVM